ncbi:MAG: hypothetical protein AAFN78_03805 [Pseudomonadota bacterium]
MNGAQRRRFAAVMVVAGAVLGNAAAGDDGDGSDDADLLEFIGSWEGDDDWLEVLDDAGSEQLRDDDEKENDAESDAENNSGDDNGAYG